MALGSSGARACAGRLAQGLREDSAPDASQTVIGESAVELCRHSALWTLQWELFMLQHFLHGCGIRTPRCGALLRWPWVPWGQQLQHWRESRLRILRVMIHT